MNQGLDIGFCLRFEQVFVMVFDAPHRGDSEHYLPVPIIRVAKMMKKRLEGILNYLRSRLTNALTESMNAKIQEIKLRAKGYRNRENFRLAILFHCGGLDMNP